MAAALTGCTLECSGLLGLAFGIAHVFGKGFDEGAVFGFAHRIDPILLVSPY